MKRIALGLWPMEGRMPMVSKQDLDTRRPTELRTTIITHGMTPHKWGHGGMAKTRELSADILHWPGMRETINRLGQKMRHQSNGARWSNTQLLDCSNPNEVPDQPWKASRHGFS